MRESTVYVIQSRRLHEKPKDVYSFRLLANACKVFDDLTGGPLPSGVYSFRIVKRVTTEEVLDSWHS